ncbi:MAG: 5-oxoprolinase subunit PxpB [Acidobacteriota bacterium]
MLENAKYFPLGEDGILFVIGNEINIEENRIIWNIARRIKDLQIKEIKEIVPAYSSLAIFYKPESIKYEQIRNLIENIVNSSENLDKEEESFQRNIVIPVCYGEDFSPDLDIVTEICSIKKEEFIEIHSSKIYRVFMLGFSPGFPYMGILDERIQVPRRETPRIKIPPGSVGIAEKQTGIYPVETAGGWRIIGRAPLKIFDLNQENPFLLSPGDNVKFKPIDSQAYSRIEKGEKEWMLYES